MKSFPVFVGGSLFYDYSRKFAISKYVFNAVTRIFGAGVYTLYLLIYFWI